MTEKNIFAYKLFCSLNIQILVHVLCKKLTPSKNYSPIKSSFLKFGRSVYLCVCVGGGGGAHYAWGSVPRLTLWIPWTFFKMSVKFFKFCKSWLYTVFLEINQNIYHSLHELLLSNIISVYLWLKSQFFSDVILFFS